ncbi:MAG: bifunctional riboflavin kinase/FAD synthetase [Nodosilinea sp.]
MWITSSLSTALTPTAIALGNFDGVHRGHQAVISRVVPNPDGATRSPGWGSGPPLRGFSYRSEPTLDQPLLPSLARGGGTLVPTVMTFAPHPQEFFSGQALPLLTPLAEKATQISHLGIEQLVLLPFNQALADLSPADFVEDLLVRQLRVQRISVGQDFCFGKNRQGTAADLKALGETVGVEVEIVPLSHRGGDRISSSRIRTALRQGDLSTATALLGRAYSLRGRVVSGQRLGRQLGFPTANLDLPADKFLPAYGVYSVWVEGLPGVIASPLAGVMNLGNRPTVGGGSPRAEVHLLGWQGGDLYGHTLQVSLQSYLRPEQTFSCLEALRQQIQVDCQLAQTDLARATVGSGG